MTQTVKVHIESIEMHVFQNLRCHWTHMMTEKKQTCPLRVQTKRDIFMEFSQSEIRPFLKP